MVHRLIVASLSIRMTNRRERGVITSLHVTRFKFGGPSISQEWLKLELSNFVHRETISISLVKGVKNHSLEGRDYGHVTHLNS